jgi:DNA-directed RNA polymerase specialized sigma subunit
MFLVQVEDSKGVFTAFIRIEQEANAQCLYERLVSIPSKEDRVVKLLYQNEITLKMNIAINMNKEASI